jgi:hypothetical protein
MPNMLTHALITERLDPVAPPERLLGATLPDFMGMVTDYYGERTRPENYKTTIFAAGVRLHGITDSVFDAEPTQVMLAEYGREDLSEFSDEERGARRAIATVGMEILFDGVIQTWPKVDELIATLKDYVAGNDIAKATGNVFVGTMVEQYFGGNKFEMYTDPERVAVLLQRRFSQRPTNRLAFSKEKIPYVAIALEEQQNRLRIYGTRLLDETVASLKTRLLTAK